MDCLDSFVQRKARETFDNTVAVGGAHAFGFLMGLDAFLIANGQEPKTFTRRGVMRWMEVILCGHDDV